MNTAINVAERELTTAELELVAGSLDGTVGAGYEAGLLGGVVGGGICYLIWGGERGHLEGSLHR